MSAQGLSFLVTKRLTDNRNLSAFFDFTVNSISTSSERSSSSDLFTGYMYNSSVVNDSSLHNCFILGSTSSSEALSSSKASTILNSSEHNLSSGAFFVPLDGLDLNSISTILDFSFSGDISAGVLLGGYRLGQETIEGGNFTTSSGFNVGVTDRGHLFLQYLNIEEEETIKVIYGAELSKRNIIGISSDKYKLSLSYFDYFNDLVKTLEVPVDDALISYTGGLLLGGAEEFYKDDPIFEGSINSFTILSGSYDPISLKDIAEGIIGDYEFNDQVTNSYSRVTGYSESIVYKTGITGYDYEVTGTLSIETGRETFTISTSEESSESYVEGEKYFKYYSLSNGNTTTKYKEELGELADGSGYIYHPTGENAYDTLGLNDISSSIQTYSETVTTGNRGSAITLDLFGKTPKTGVLNDVSGVEKTALYETWDEVTPATSGISLDVDGTELFKNYIYYMGGRS